MEVLTLQTLIIRPVLGMMGGKFDDPRAHRLLRAIAIQESGLMHRAQYPTGPAKSIWQMERGGGVTGVYTHSATRTILRDWCVRLIVPFSITSIYDAIEYNDHLACVCARLLLYSDPQPLPADEAGAWAYYSRTWRPGKPRPNEWHGNWIEAGMIP